MLAMILSVLLAASAEVLAQGQDASGSSDHPMITRYAGSVIDGYEVQPFDEFVLPLGPAVKDAAGNRVPSKKESLEGQITRILYRGPEDRSTLEIIRNYRSAFEGAGFEILYACSEQDCGTLFHWLLYKEKQIKNTKTSGQAFDVPKDVRYLAAKKTKDGAIIHVALLVAVDAMWTKKPVTLLEVIESKVMDTGMVTVDADAMAKGIDATGHMAIYGIYFDTDSARIKEESSSTLQEIGKLLRRRPSLNLLVVGHTDSQGGYDYNTNLSQRRAEAVVKALVDGGIDQKRLKAAGVGYLSPVASNDQEAGRAKNRRVELVKQ
jgi:outer membrane protein OmpA-like peptidoglycan-associated protein